MFTGTCPDYVLETGSVYNPKSELLWYATARSPGTPIYRVFSALKIF